jgi:hypothetical protein
VPADVAAVQQSAAAEPSRILKNTCRHDFITQARKLDVAAQTDTLKPNETLVIEVCFADDLKLWNGVPCNQTVSMRAVFEIAGNDWTKKFSVWTGRVESDWNNYYFADPFP